MSILYIVGLILAILATIRCVRAGKQGVELVLWLLFIWLVLWVGSIVALCVVRRAR